MLATKNGCASVGQNAAPGVVVPACVDHGLRFDRDRTITSQTEEVVERGRVRLFPLGSDCVYLKNPLLILLSGLSTQAFALDVSAISKGLVEAGPWGKNAELLPYLLGWFGVLLLIAVLLKILHREYDQWATRRRARKAARNDMENWILEVGIMLNVPAPPDLKPGATPALWRQYRHQVKLALGEHIRRSRDAMSQLADLRSAAGQ